MALARFRFEDRLDGVPNFLSWKVRVTLLLEENDILKVRVILLLKENDICSMLDLEDILETMK
jgi:hypothetical protein